MEFSSTNPLSAPSRTIFLFLWVFLLTSCSGDSEETLHPPLLSSTMHNSLPNPLRERLDEVLASITQAPEDAEKRHLLGVVYQAHGMDRPAAVAFEQAVLLDPQKTRSWYHLARLRSRLGDLEGAVDSMNRCLALDGSHAPSSWYRAQWLFELGRLEEAAEDFQRVIDLAPKEPAGTEGLARLLLASEKPQEAASLLEALLSRDQHATHARYLLGTAYRWFGRTSDAARLLAAGAETPSTIPDTWNDEVHAAAVGYKAIMDAA
ncbi:MAG: tetratricopeptide repeat protein, partial [Planctomycetota bacterium]|nr:tetratricopeptide repeat protein [Planctomycetota bacterium]